MIDTRTTASWKRSTALALVVAAVGIVIQIISGADYPAVPPGLVILLVAAGFVWFAPWRWSPVVGAAAALSQFVGLFAAGQTPRLFDMDPVGDSIGLWLQLLAVAFAMVAGITAVVRNYRG